MTFTQTFLRTFNAPWPVLFAGFESDTFKLQRNGWDLSMEQLMDRGSMRLALRHEKAGVYALSADIDYHFMRNFDLILKGGINYRDLPPFQIICMGNNTRLQIMPVRSVSFKPVSGIPEFYEAQSYREVKIEDAIPFKSLSMDAPEIVVAPSSVPELMELILKMQDPKQAEIREKRRREAFRDKTGEMISEMRPVSDIRAQIITLAS